jgi:hypothetical protein
MTEAMPMTRAWGMVLLLLGQSGRPPFPKLMNDGSTAMLIAWAIFLSAWAARLLSS